MSGRTLIYGWGNPGRGDDGLGPAFVRALEKVALPGVHFDTNYQLQVEDSAQIGEYARVIFVDADRTCDRSYHFSRISPARGHLGFSTHSVSPETVLQLARDLFGGSPDAWVLGIRGYDFELGSDISARAGRNLAQALRFVESALRQESLHSHQPDLASVPAQPIVTGEPCLTSNE